MNTNALNWLTQNDNPAIKYRAQTELMGVRADSGEAREWIYSALPADWHETKGLWYTYYITALAECGLKRADVPYERITRAFDELDGEFDSSCKDIMLLTALIKLGYAEHAAVRGALGRLKSVQLPDGGFVCLHRQKKLNYTPKSCYKANLHALMLLAQLKKAGITADFGAPLIDYFLSRDIFYKSADKSALVLNAREGWRTIDTFYPFEVMRVGLQNVVEAFAALGLGKDAKLRAAWDMLFALTGDTGKVTLKGTLAKSYLPKERAGKPAKWPTFYALLARKEAGI